MWPENQSADNVWEFRTTDVRMFGWFPGPPNVFVGQCVRLKTSLLKPDGDENLEEYARCQLAVVNWRRAIKLDQHVWNLKYDDLYTHLRR
jgi:hypothetical protein